MHIFPKIEIPLYMLLELILLPSYLFLKINIRTPLAAPGLTGPGREGGSVSCMETSPESASPGTRKLRQHGAFK